MFRSWLLIQFVSFTVRGFTSFVGVALQGLWTAILFMGMCLVALRVNLPVFVHRSAVTWADRAVRLGFPTIWYNELVFVLEVICSVMVFTGLAFLVLTIAFFGSLIF